MTAYEFLKVNKSVFATAVRAGVNMLDASNVELYERYMALGKCGYKKEYVVEKLIEEFGVPRRTLFRILKRMEQVVSIM